MSLREEEFITGGTKIRSSILGLNDGLVVRDSICSLSIY